MLLSTVICRVTHSDYYSYHFLQTSNLSAMQTHSQKSRFTAKGKRKLFQTAAESLEARTLGLQSNWRIHSSLDLSWFSQFIYGIIYNLGGSIQCRSQNRQINRIRLESKLLFVQNRQVSHDWETELIQISKCAETNWVFDFHKFITKFLSVCKVM